MVGRGANVVEDPFVVELAAELARGREVGLVITKLDAGLDAIEQRGADSEIAVAGEHVDLAADVAIDAEDFLDDDQAALWRARRLGHIAVQLVPILGGQRYILTHALNSPFVVEF